jgi:hypothetical protein
LAKKSAKVYHSLNGSTEQLQVAWWTYIFLWLGLNNEKSIHTLPLRLSPRYILMWHRTKKNLIVSVDKV